MRHAARTNRSSKLFVFRFPRDVVVVLLLLLLVVLMCWEDEVVLEDLRELLDIIFERPF